MAAIGSMRKKLTGFNDEGDDDYGSAGMYFNPSMFPPHRPEKEVCFMLFVCWFSYLIGHNTINIQYIFLTFMVFVATL